MVKRPKFYVGIDPGQNGGITCISSLGAVSAMKMPSTEKDLWLLVKFFSGKDCRAVLERAQAMPKQGVSSAFKYGAGYGFLRACLVAAEIQFIEVHPRAWMSFLKIRTRRKTETKTQWKNHLKQVSQQWFPKMHITLQTCDSMLIAEYCRRSSS